MLFFKAFGVSVFALALFKNLLLFSLYLFTYLNVRFVTRSHICGVLGAVSLLFIPQVSWESQRDLTHTVLAAAWVTATLFVFLRLREKSWRDHAIFGACVRLGILSKYNYLAFLFGLILASLSVERFRSVVWNRLMIFSIALCLLVLAPHLFWALGNREMVSSAAHKFRQPVEPHLFGDIRNGIVNLFGAVLFHVGPIAGIFLLVLRRARFDRKTVANNVYARLVLRKYGLILVILAFRVTGFNPNSEVACG